MKETEKLYYDAVEAGELPRDAGTEEELLGRKVSEIREDSLRNSLSIWKALGDFFKGRSITLLQCKDEIQRFTTHIEKPQLRDRVRRSRTRRPEPMDIIVLILDS
ncbi:hypothetical protein C8J57DRAFT_1238736 [Mycena rebaudengoi]|nr:hypothetical protein C8J57DRAFT_1238736 [Mycena rebaudengoi]